MRIREKKTLNPNVSQTRLLFCSCHCHRIPILKPSWHNHVLEWICSELKQRNVSILQVRTVIVIQHFVGVPLTNINNYEIRVHNNGHRSTDCILSYLAVQKVYSTAFTIVLIKTITGITILHRNNERTNTFTGDFLKLMEYLASPRSDRSYFDFVSITDHCYFSQHHNFSHFAPRALLV